MWGKSRQSEPKAEEVLPPRLKPAVRQARIEAAERTGIVVDLRDAELARLEILNEALDPVFAEISPEIELFDRGISRGEVPRLWVDAIAHVAMGHDKRVYRFVQDTSFGRKVLAESNDVDSIVEAVTQYVARRLVERERALAADPRPAVQELLRDVRAQRRRWRWKAIKAFVFGLIAGVVALFFIAWLLAPPPQ
ncbi:MAG TPA: hypothetical protein VFA53_05800 [Xanthobacteraceae bacterium]|nr:hypothetical protein [Xanthobacteraceae bacterium]